MPNDKPAVIQWVCPNCGYIIYAPETSRLECASDVHNHREIPMRPNHQQEG